MQLVFVRHGRADGVDGRCIGSTDVPLAPDGHAAVRALAARWRTAGTGCRTGPPTRVVASPLRRAIDSARIVGTVWDRPVELDQRLRELDFGSWDGQRWSTIEETDGDRLRAWSERWTEVAPPDGESVSALIGRARDWLAGAGALAPGRPDTAATIVVVAHAGWIRAALTALLDRPVAAMFEFPADHAHATIVRVDPHGTELVALNAPDVP